MQEIRVDIVDIQEKLRDNVYKNEEHIRLSLVCRLLMTLGWDIWNPREVNTEFPAIPMEDKTRVDIALFAKGSTPSVFIETKALGKVATSLSEVERQVRDYNRNNTALFSIITDGRIWRFYFSQTGGEFHEKCFKECDLLNDDLETLEETFLLFLKKDNISSGLAEYEAREYHQLTKQEKAVQDSLYQAEQMMKVWPFPSLPEAVAELVSQKGFDVSATKAAELLQRKPKQEFLASNSLESFIKQPVVYTDRDLVNFQILLLDPENPGDLSFTEVEGTIGEKYAKNWNQLVRTGIELALKYGNKINTLNEFLPVNIKEGKCKNNGWFYIFNLKISVQNIDANKSAKTIFMISKMLRCKLDLTITWNGKSPRAGEKAIIRWP